MPNSNAKEELQECAKLHDGGLKREITTHNEKKYSSIICFPSKKYKFLDKIFIMRWYISAVFDMIYSALWFQIFLLY